MTVLQTLRNFYHRCASPRHFYHIAGRALPWLAVCAALLIAAGVFGGLVLAPTHYDQGEVYRIIYLHVPAASLSLMIYAFMATAAGIGLIWKIKMADIMAASAAPIGASMTLLALATGSLWGKPTWGTWWLWDARMTSELVLLFLYLGFIALQRAIEDRRTASHASAILALAGVVNVPIVKFSVDPELGFRTLHQGSTAMFDSQQMAPSMAVPLLLNIAGFVFFFLTVLLLRARNEVLERERRASWVRKLLEQTDD